jgi:hypothetical protein
VQTTEELVKETKKSYKIVLWLRRFTVGLAILFLLGLTVQLLRGKLWLVGAVGVWALLGATLLAAVTTTVLENSTRLKATAIRLRSKLSPYGVAVAGLTLVGLWLRVWGQKMGLPYIIPADESMLVDSGTHLLKTGNFDPQMYHYPSFYIYLQAAVAGLQFLWGSFTGLYHSLNDLPDRSYAITTTPEVYLWGRTFTALVGSAAIPLTYGVVKRLWGDRRAGLLAAGFVTFSALATEHSHYISVDMPMATLALLALWPAYNIIEEGRRRDYILAGLVAGLAIGTKWSAAVIIILLLVAHLLRVFKNHPFRLHLSSFILSLSVAGATVLATTPYLLARIKEYSNTFVDNLIKYQSNDALESVTYPWLGNLQVLWQDSLGLFLLGLGGVLLLALRRKPADWLALCFPLVYLLNMNGYRLVYPRNALPLTLYFAVFGALFVVWCFDQVRERLPAFKLNRVTTWAVALGLPVLLLGVVMYAPLSSIFYGNDFNDRPFSYARAEDWIKTQVGPGPLKLVEMRPQQWGDYPNLIARAGENGANDFSLAYYRERGIQFIAVNRDRAVGAGMGGSYPELLQPALIVNEIETKTVGQPGPPFVLVRTGVTPTTLKLNYLLNADFGGKLRLLGLNAGKIQEANAIYLPPQGEAGPKSSWPTFKPGEVIGLSLYWQVLAPVGQDYTVFVHLRPVGQPATNAASRDTPPLFGAYPTSRWKVGEIVTDNPNLSLPADLPPGDYTLMLGFYLNDGKFTPLPLSDGAISLTLGQLKVTK